MPSRRQGSGRNIILITANVGISGGGVLVDVVLCFEKVLGLFYGGFELNPLLVGRLIDAVIFNTRGL